MPQDHNYNDLVAFLTVAKERSFTKAAAKLGVSQSALSQTVRNLEERLGLRLLTRTTRSVSPTDAGDRLLDRIGPRFDEINSEVAALSEMRDRPAGTFASPPGNMPRSRFWPPPLPVSSRKIPTSMSRSRSTMA